jgi:hypothetical protein
VIGQTPATDAEAELRRAAKLAARAERRLANRDILARVIAFQSEVREELIRTPLARRFADAAAGAVIERLLDRKTSSAVQRTVVADIVARSFRNGTTAEWVRPDIGALAWRAGIPLHELETALWLAAAAGLLERRRIQGVWFYTAVPEIWQYLPDYPAAEPAQSEGAA